MANGFYSFDCAAFERFMGDAADHYEKSSPVVVTYLDAVCEWLRDGSLTLRDVMHVDSLRENDIWQDAHGAGNLAYKQLSLRDALPQNVTIAF